MKKLLTLLALGLTLSFGAAHAADATADCNAKAAEKKLAGAAKNSFVKKCVADEKAGAKPEAAKPETAAKPATASKPAAAASPAAATDKKVSQQDKMKLCNAEAKGLKGDEFKKKRNECLKK